MLTMFLMLWIAVLSWIAGTLALPQGSTLSRVEYPIVYKRISSFRWIWNDRGSGARKNVGFWHPFTAQTGFFALGDVATKGYGEPSSVVLVKELIPGSLVEPLGFSEVWNDRGSGANSDVKVLSMTAPSGYTCLGHAAVKGYGNLPPKRQYRCVKTEYITDGKYSLVWRDRGSGARRDVGIWQNEQNQDDVWSLDIQTFTSFATHGVPSGRPKVLSGKFAKASDIVSPEDIEKLPLKVYETRDYSKIWDDGGSGANHDVTLSRANGPAGFFSLGDIAVAYHGLPTFTTLVVKPWMDESALVAPSDLQLIWKDRGSGARDDGSIWRPICPGGYRALGHLSNKSHSKPSADGIRCIRYNYTEPGQWAHVWGDWGSGANWDVNIWKAVPSSGRYGMSLMSAVRSHGPMGFTAHVLKPNVAIYIPNKPLRKILIQNLEYDLAQAKFLDTSPEVLLRTTVENHGDTEQTVSRWESYSYTETRSWNVGVGVEIGVETEVKAGIPLIVEGKVKISVKVSTSYNYGESKMETKTDRITATIKVKPHSQKTAMVAGTKYIVDLPYTASVVSYYVDGEVSTRHKVHGVYRGTEIRDFRITYEKDKPITY